MVGILGRLVVRLVVVGIGVGIEGEVVGVGIEAMEVVIEGMEEGIGDGDEDGWVKVRRIWELGTLWTCFG